MLKLIKQLFAPPLPRVQIVGFSDGLLSFRSTKELPFLKTVRVRTMENTGSVTATLEVTSYDQNEKVYRAVLSDSESKLQEMNLGRRSTVRLTRFMRVLSHQIPGFFCSTEDISVNGMRLATKTPLKVGQALDLQVELDDANLEPVRLAAVVRWSACKGSGSYHSGLEFRGLEHDPGTRGILETFIEERLSNGL